MIPEFDCCTAILEGFTFTNIREAQPPEQRGVYIIRVTRRGEPVSMIMEQVQLLTGKVNWPMLTFKILNRVERLRRIADCSIVYIGSAGTYKGSQNTLYGRYREFTGRHTIMYPIWALLAYGWELDYGWKAIQEPANVEAGMKQLYRQLHRNNLPALMKK